MLPGVSNAHPKRHARPPMLRSMHRPKCPTLPPMLLLGPSKPHNTSHQTHDQSQHLVLLPPALPVRCSTSHIQQRAPLAIGRAGGFRCRRDGASRTVGDYEGWGVGVDGYEGLGGSHAVVQDGGWGWGWGWGWGNDGCGGRREGWDGGDCSCCH